MTNEPAWDEEGCSEFTEEDRATSIDFSRFDVEEDEDEE